MTGTAMPDHPETRGEPIITAAIQSILVDQFKDELAHGKSDFPDGTHSAYQAEKEATLASLVANVQVGQATFTDFIIMHAFEVAAETDPARLRRVLTSMGATVVQWIESLDSRYGQV